jgi:hypothetical protein
MNVRLCILFKPPTEQDWQAMGSIAKGLSKEPESIRVYPEADPNWLVVEFTMPTEPQYKAEPKIMQAVRLSAWNRHDLTFGFPMTEAERIRADRKLTRAKERRKARRTAREG